MKYIIEQYKWHNKEYYHLFDSRVFESDKIIPDTSYSKNGSYFIIRKLEDEIQASKRTEKRRGG